MSINRIAYLLENNPIEARALLLETLERCENRRVRAARIFGVSTRTLGRWLIKAGFERDPGGPRTSRKATSCPVPTSPASVLHKRALAAARHLARDLDYVMPRNPREYVDRAWGPPDSSRFDSPVYRDKVAALIGQAVREHKEPVSQDKENGAKWNGGV